MPAAPAPAPPPVVAEPGWTSHWPFPEIGDHVSFVSAGTTGGRLRVAYFKRAADDHLVGRAWFGPETEGPPGHAHGGSIAAVLDEALGAVAWAADLPVVVASLQVDFRLMVPLGTDATFDAWIARVDGRKVHTRACLRDGERVLAEASAVCVRIDDDQLEHFKAQQRARRIRQA